MFGKASVCVSLSLWTLAEKILTWNFFTYQSEAAILYISNTTLTGISSHALPQLSVPGVNYEFLHATSPVHLSLLSVPRSLLPSVSPVVIKYPNPPTLMICPMNLDCLFLSFIIACPSSASLRTSSLDFSAACSCN